MAWSEDWTGSNELRGNLEPYLAELQVALNERVDITNGRQDKLGTITKPTFLTTSIQATRLWSIKTIMTQVESLVDDLIPEFVNTTDADEWEGQSASATPPMTAWTEAALLSHISETRIDHSALKEWSWDWLSQQQSMLDKLRWTWQKLNDISAPPTISCNSCSPSLPLQFTLTLSGMAGTIWDGRVGSHTMTYYSGCTWYDAYPGPRIALSFFGGDWLVDVQNDVDDRDGTIQYTGGDNPCSAPGDFGSHSGCSSVTASDCSGLGTTSCVVAGAVVTLGFKGGEYRQGAGGSFADATTAWNAASWATGDGGETSEHFAKEASGTFTIHRRRFEFAATADEDEYDLDAPTITKDFEAGSPTSSPKKTFKFYAALTSPASGTYQHNDYDGDEDEFSIFSSVSTPTDTATVPTLSIGNFSSVSATAPGTGAQHGWKATVPFNIYIMYKWDVVGGLEKAS